MGQDRMVYTQIWSEKSFGRLQRDEGSTNLAFRVTPTFATWALEWIKLGTVQQNHLGHSRF